MGEGWDIIVEFVAEVEDIFDVNLWLWYHKRINKILCFGFLPIQTVQIRFVLQKRDNYANVFELHDKILNAVKPFWREIWLLL